VTCLLLRCFRHRLTRRSPHPPMALPATREIFVLDWVLEGLEANAGRRGGGVRRCGRSGLRAKAGRPKEGEENGDNITIFKRGTQADYIPARLERDGHTELLAKIERGETLPMSLQRGLVLIRATRVMSAHNTAAIQPLAHHKRRRGPSGRGRADAGQRLLAHSSNLMLFTLPLALADLSRSACSGDSNPSPSSSTSESNDAPPSFAGAGFCAPKKTSQSARRVASLWQVALGRSRSRSVEKK
jgi:hypothetical protein